MKDVVGDEISWGGKGAQSGNETKEEKKDEEEEAAAEKTRKISGRFLFGRDEEEDAKELDEMNVYIYKMYPR